MNDLLREPSEIETLRRHRGALTSGLSEIRHALVKLAMAGVPVGIGSIEILVQCRMSELTARLKELGAEETKEKVQ